MKSLENSQWSQSFQKDPPQQRLLSGLELKVQKSFLGREGGRVHQEKQHCSWDASSYSGVFCGNSMFRGKATTACTLEHPSVARRGQAAWLPLSPLQGRTTASSVFQLHPLSRARGCLQAPPPGCLPASGLTSSFPSCPRFRPVLFGFS